MAFKKSNLFNKRKKKVSSSVFTESGKTLIFLESNTKKKTIKGFLGSEYTIFATGGHLSDLSKTGEYNLGVNLQTFDPNYEIIDRKKKLIEFWESYLKQSKPSQIFLATDPDREGEAIAQEIVRSLNLRENDYSRLLFREITFDEVKKSLENPLRIDRNLTEAQLSRQVLDRMIGFCLSTLLQKKIQAWSAGRVQSVVLKLIVDREREINEYGDKKEFIISPVYRIKRNVFYLSERDSESGLKVYQSFEEANSSKEVLDSIFYLEKIESSEKYCFPKQPLTTSNLLYEAKIQLGFSIYKTTVLAQGLYEGVNLKDKGKRVSLITYPRTDSIRISKTFASKAFQYIKSIWGSELCNFRDTSASTKGKKGNVQDAHEAIRPTYLSHTPATLEGEGLEKDQFSLYKLIFNHTLASLMQPAKYLKTIYSFLNRGRSFQMTEDIIISPGFFTFIENAYRNHKIKKSSVLDKQSLEKIEIREIETEEYMGNVPKRYTEGSLIRTLERLEIGRPSTYNAFTRIMIKRRYSIFDKKKNFIPTELGLKVNDWLQKFFPFLINEKYTAGLEEKLDMISQGETTYLAFIKAFWNDFFPTYKRLET